MRAVLRVRLIVGIALAALIIGLLLVDAWLANLRPLHCPLPGLDIDLGAWLCNGAVSTGLICVLVWLTAHELVQLARALGFQPSSGVARLGAIALVLAPYVAFHVRAEAGTRAESWAVLLLALALAAAFARQAARHRTQAAMVNLATTMFIICYAGGLASFLSRLRMEVGGTAGIALLMFSAFAVKMTDAGAYFVGSAVGRHKLIAWLSPRKTWEGFLGGQVVAILCAVGVGGWLHQSGWVAGSGGALSSPVGLAAFGLTMGLFSAAGDLCASLLKRDAAVKDSGAALPGLGGILDVMDSVLMAAPAAWFFWTRVAQYGVSAAGP